MLNNRLAAAHSVRDAFLPLERNAGRLSEEAAACLATIYSARASSRVGAHTGSAPIADIARGAALLAEAHQCFVEAHPKLAALIDETGLARFYAAGDDECPENKPNYFFTVGQARAA